MADFAKGLWFAVSLLICTPAPSLAQSACPPNKLGVSRIVTIDPAGGPRFGEPLGDSNFLAPGEVVLTFDDGPSPKSTRAILAALAAECTKATFFSVGEMAKAYPEVLREVAEQGHTIGTHTWSHKNLPRLSDERAHKEIDGAFGAVQKALGKPAAPFFRFPYLNESAATISYLKTHNIAMFAIDVDSLDWHIHTPPLMIQRVMKLLQHRGRGIILFHDIHKSTAAAMPSLLALIRAKGYRVVHMQPNADAHAMSQ